jgi:tetratricopeptide (TPR) repeat protein
MLVAAFLIVTFLRDPARAGLQNSPANPADAEPLILALNYRYNLEYSEARKAIEGWLAQHPEDLHGLNALATVMLHGEMFRHGILAAHIYGDMGQMFRTGRIPYPPQFQQQLFSTLQKAETLAENRLKKNPKDQEALYWAGVSHATAAIFYFTMAKSYLAALHEATDARKLHAQVLKINTSFTDAWLVIGVNDYVIGSLPWYMKVLASLVGYHGNREQGTEEVRQVATQGHWARDDAKLILAVLYRREKKYPETLAVLQDMAKSYPRNFLLQREIAGVYEMQGDLRSAARVYDEIVDKWESRQAGFAMMPAAMILYESGQIHLQLGDKDKALGRFEEATRLPGKDVFVFRAELAAADLDLQMDHRTEAIRKYEHVAQAVPDTDEGKTAKRALRKIQRPG